MTMGPDMQSNDVERLRRVVPLWRATRAWAEELLCTAFGLERALDILKSENRGHRRIPGTNWFYQTHGGGVDLYRGVRCGGIDFDFDKVEPDAWRLRIFVEKQIKSGELPGDLAELVHDDKRFEAAAHEMLAALVERRAT